jgi:hypothetical protein
MRGVLRYRRTNEEIGTIIKTIGVDDITKATKEQLEAIVNHVFEDQQVVVRSLRDHPLTIDEGGAQLVEAPTQVDFDCAEFRQQKERADMPTSSQLAYYQEVETIARKLLGGKVHTLFCTDHILRESRPDATAVGATAGPIKTVHNDFTEIYGEQLRRRYVDHAAKMSIIAREQLKELKGITFTKEELDKYRIVVLNTWRPIHSFPLRREPLAVCDNRSIDKTDLIKRITGIW